MYLSHLRMYLCIVFIVVASCIQYTYVLSLSTIINILPFWMTCGNPACLQPLSCLSSVWREPLPPVLEHSTTHLALQVLLLYSLHALPRNCDFQKCVGLPHLLMALSSFYFCLIGVLFFFHVKLTGLNFTGVFRRTGGEKIKEWKTQRAPLKAYSGKHLDFAWGRPGESWVTVLTQPPWGLDERVLTPSPSILLGTQHCWRDEWDGMCEGSGSVPVTEQVPN